MGGYVYLMRKGHLTKIGQSRSPQERAKQLRWDGHAVELIWLLACEDATRTERALHARFWRVRMHGEWFDLTPAEVEWITQQTEASICEGFDHNNNSTWSRSFLAMCRWLDRNP